MDDKERLAFELIPGLENLGRVGNRKGVGINCKNCVHHIKTKSHCVLICGNTSSTRTIRSPIDFCEKFKTNH